MTKHLYRTLQTGLVFLTIAVIGTAFYLQYVIGLQPCPLCLMQRFCALMLAVICLVSVFQQTLERARVGTIFQMLFALFGLFFAARQLWLQHLPVGQAPACIPDFSVLIHYFPWTDVLHALLWGAGDCSEVSWKWLGFSMAAWSALYFFMIILVSGFIFFQQGVSLICVKKKSK